MQKMRNCVLWNDIQQKSCALGYTTQLKSFYWHNTGDVTHSTHICPIRYKPLKGVYFLLRGLPFPCRNKTTLSLQLCHTSGRPMRAGADSFNDCKTRRRASNDLYSTHQLDHVALPVSMSFKQGEEPAITYILHIR